MDAAEAAFFLLVVAALWLLPAYWVGRVAVRKGRRFWPWFVSALVFWLVAAIAVVIADDPRGRGAAPPPPPAPPQPPPPLPPPQRVADPARDRLDALERLHRLHEEGALTAAEFEAEKRQLLNRD